MSAAGALCKEKQTRYAMFPFHRWEFTLEKRKKWVSNEGTEALTLLLQICF